MTIKLPLDFKPDDYLAMPILQAQMPNGEVVLVMLCRKGGGLITQFNSDPSRSYHISLEHLANAAIEVAMFMEKNGVPEEAVAEPMPVTPMVEAPADAPIPDQGPQVAS